MIYIVLGMHKSGTTLVAQLLHASGVHMVDDNADIGYDTGNKCERHLSKSINKELLGSPSYARSRDELLREPLSISEGQRKRMASLVHELNARHDDWGFKDPRTSLTYSAWAKNLPPHRLVLVYRSYVELLHRYNSGIRQLQLIKMRAVLHAWTHYNIHCIEHLRTAELPPLILSYEALMSTEEELARLSAFIGRDVTDMRRKSLRRNPVAKRYHLPPLARLVAATLPTHPTRILHRLDEMRRDQCDG